jgi:hypothetical protein
MSRYHESASGGSWRFADADMILPTRFQDTQSASSFFGTDGRDVTNKMGRVVEG